MTKCILHGGFTRKNNKLNRTFYEEIARDVPNKGTVLLVYFASESGDNSERAKEDSASLEKQSHGKGFNFLHATKRNFLTQIKRSDAIYFRGGSTDKLLKVLRTYPNLRSLVKGKTVAGSSAGAYALAQYGSSHTGEGVREGLGVVPVRVVCHYKSPELPPNAKAVRKLKETAKDLELVLLKDYEWRTFIF